MEAATGAPAAAEGQPTEGQTEGQEPQEDGGVDLAEWQRSVDQQLSSAADGVRQLGDLIQTRIPEQQGEPEPDFEQQFSDLFEQGGGYVDPQQLQGLVQQQIQRGVQEAVAPLQQQLGTFQQQMTAQELSGLQSEFPELAEQKAADGLADSVVNTAVQLGIPAELADGLIQNANFVRLVHLAEKARGRAQQETPAGQGQQIPQIETGGGAAPGSSSGADEWDQFLTSRKPQGSVW